MLTTGVLLLLLVLVLVDRERSLGVYRAEVKRLNDDARVTDIQHNAERAELLTRIQHPQIVQLPPQQLDVEREPAEPDEFDQVGTISMTVPDNDPDKVETS